MNTHRKVSGFHEVTVRGVRRLKAGFGQLVLEAVLYDPCVFWVFRAPISRYSVTPIFRSLGFPITAIPAITRDHGDPGPPLPPAFVPIRPKVVPLCPNA